MNIERSFYDLTGRYVTSLSMPDEEAVRLNTPPGTTAVSGRFSEDTYLHQGEVKTIPAPPNDEQFWVFDTVTGEWTDQRTDAELQAASEQQRRDAIDSINRVRGEARTRFITSIPGQDMVYMEKEREAREWVAARATDSNAPDPAEYPHLANEVGTTAPDMDAVAQVYLNMAAMFRAFSAIIEGEAMAALSEVEAAPTGEDAFAVAQAFPTRLVAALAGAPIDL
ncbi:hypothetical protein [Paracoccus marcusii]|uniref:hypothetical protein n=1 Tax=Paracoccus marcusii TaxID=59779 RepID=UPI00249002E6|nr:hypothetical protein [Paracoccus marcusii]